MHLDALPNQKRNDTTRATPVPPVSPVPAGEPVRQPNDQSAATKRKVRTPAVSRRRKPFAL